MQWARCPMDAKANAKHSDVPVWNQTFLVMTHASVETTVGTGCKRHPLKTVKWMTVTRMIIVMAFRTATYLVLHGKVRVIAHPIFLVFICCSPYVPEKQNNSKNIIWFLLVKIKTSVYIVKIQNWMNIIIKWNPGLHTIHVLAPVYSCC